MKGYKKSIRISSMLYLVINLLLFSGCGLREKKELEDYKINQEFYVKKKYEKFSGNFNPFYFETKGDEQVVKMTQVKLLTTDWSGNAIMKSINGESELYLDRTITYVGMCDISMDYDKNHDITSCTIGIRDDALFSDGEPVTIDDVIFTYYVLADPSYQGPFHVASLPIIGLEEYETLDYIEGIKKVNNNEAVIMLHGDMKERIKELCDIYIAPLHYYGDLESYDFKGKQFGFKKGKTQDIIYKEGRPIGAGPYKLIEYKDQRILFEANENYYLGMPETYYVEFIEE